MSEVISAQERIKQAQGDIQRRWLNLIVESYPADASGFLKNQRNRFLNPVGETLRIMTESVVGFLAGEVGVRESEAAIEEVVRIRAVQEFLPSQAVAFVFQLKQVVRDCLGIPGEGSRNADWLAIDTEIDRLALRAFDDYVRNRERIFEIRANDLKRQSYLASRRMESELNRAHDALDVSTNLTTAEEA